MPAVVTSLLSAKDRQRVQRLAEARRNAARPAPLLPRQPSPEDLDAYQRRAIERGYPEFITLDEAGALFRMRPGPKRATNASRYLKRRGFGPRLCPGGDGQVLVLPGDAMYAVEHGRELLRMRWLCHEVSQRQSL
jgi:hypothetical protein